MGVCVGWCGMGFVALLYAGLWGMLVSCCLFAGLFQVIIVWFVITLICLPGVYLGLGLCLF